MSAATSYDEEALNQAVDALACMQDANMTKPVDAHLEVKESGYEIVPETQGTEVDKAKVKEVIKKAESMIGEPVEVIDSFFETVPENVTPLWYLAKSLELLSTADVAYFAEGWQEARGCKIEHECAVQYGIDRIE